MAIPSYDNLKGMDFVDKGKIFCETAAKSTIDLTTLDVVYQGTIFDRNPYSSGAVASTSDFFLMFP